MITAISSEKDESAVYFQRMMCFLRDARTSPRSYKTCMNIASINAGYYISEKGLSIETLQVLIAALNNVFGSNMSVGKSDKLLINALEETVDSQKQAISEQRNLIEMYKKRLGISITDTQTNNQNRNQSIIPLISRLP